MHTLMSEPLALLDQLRLQCQRREIATRNESRMLLTEEQWRLSRRNLIDLVGGLIMRHGGGE